MVGGVGTTELPGASAVPDESISGTEAEVGKRVGKDSGAGKATFVNILGANGARARAADLVAEAAQHLAPYGARAACLAEAAQFVVDRRS